MGYQIINGLRHSMAVTGVGRVHAVLGGFHLTGRLFEPLIAPTALGVGWIAIGSAMAVVALRRPRPVVGLR